MECDSTRLAVVVLQHVRPGAVQHARRAAGDRRGVPAGLDARRRRPRSRTAARPSSGTNAWKMPIALEPPPTQAATASGSAPVRSRHCAARLDADAAHEVAHDLRERVRAGGRAEQVVGLVDGADPVAQRLVERVLERARAVGHRDDGRAEHPHPGHVERLPLGVHLAHVDDALEVEQRGRGGAGHAVLAGAGLGDHPRLAHPLGEQRLAEHVAHLVRAGVVAGPRA